MKVAVDATAARSFGHGVGTYVSGLLGELLRLPAPDEYLVFLSRDAATGLLPTGVDGSRLEARRVPSARPLRLLWQRWGLDGAARRSGADLLWGCHNSLPSGRRLPQVVTIHDIGLLTLPQYYPRAKVRYFRHAIRHAVRQADLVVAVSEFTSSELQSHLSVPAARVRVVPNGVGERFRRVTDAATRAEVRRRYALPERFILAVGVPEPKKNFERLIRSWLAARAARPDLPRLVIGGGRSMGWKNHQLYELARSSPDTVFLADFIEHDDLPAVYNLADVFVFPSLYEGFGLPPLEAMACGTPVVTSRVASLPEVVGDAALLVDPTSEEEIGTAVARLLDDAGLAADLSARGVVRAGNFTWRRSAGLLHEVLGEVAAQ